MSQTAQSKPAGRGGPGEEAAKKFMVEANRVDKLEDQEEKKKWKFGFQKQF
jgi:hypothetical protein